MTDAHAFEEDCRRADIVITPLVAPARCRQYTTVIDARVLSKTGSLALMWPPANRPGARLTAHFAQPATPRPWTPTPWLAARDTPPDDATLPPLVPHDPATWGPVTARAEPPAAAPAPLDPTDAPEIDEVVLEDEEGDGGR